MKISPTKYGLEKVSCPKGSVPIRRVTKDDLIQGKYVFNDRNLTENGFRIHVSLLIYKTEFTIIKHIMVQHFINIYVIILNM
jgi:hypothetical protein